MYYHGYMSTSMYHYDVTVTVLVSMTWTVLVWPSMAVSAVCVWSSICFTDITVLYIIFAVTSQLCSQTVVQCL
jgi:hypothetical protein